MPARSAILKDQGFRIWWKEYHHYVDPDTQSEKKLQGAYRAYYISMGIVPPWEQAATPSEPTGYTPDQIAEYNAYLTFVGDNPDLNLPTPANMDDYFANRDKWIADFGEPTEPTEPAKPEYSDEELREYYTYQNYASRYRDPDDWVCLGIDDYFGSWDLAQEQLDEWKGEASTAEQERIERETEQAEYDKWALSPEESARRREESYEYSQEARERAEYAAKEAYGETPQYAQSFYDWFGTQGAKSTPLQSFIENMYPRLKTEYQAGLPKLTGFPTREEARAEAERREAGFEQWLPGQVPSVEGRFWGQAPRYRGEYPGTFAPRIRTWGA